MRVERNNDCLICVIVVILFGILIGYVFYSTEPTSQVDNEPYKQLYDALASERAEIITQINDLKTKNDIQAKKIDSLEAVKKQIKIIYVTKVREIDTLNSNGIVNEFKGIFAKGNR